jgi:hypothetical protein
VSCLRRGGHVLKALVTGLCALVLCATPAAAQAGTSAGLGGQLARHVGAMQTSTSVIRFFEQHRWLLSDPRFQKEATLRLRLAKRTLAASRAKADRNRVRIARQRAEQEHRRFVAELRGSPEPALQVGDPRPVEVAAHQTVIILAAQRIRLGVVQGSQGACGVAE